MQRETLLIQTTRKDHLVAGFAALAISIHILESIIPSPVPGIKPGLANLITLYVLLRHGWAMAASVSLLRVIGASLLLGTFLSPTFVMSLAGALASLLILAITYRLPGRPLGAMGLAILAAQAHLLAQFMTAWALFIPHPSLFTLLPVLLTAALISGTLGGILLLKIMQRVDTLTSQ